MNYTSGDGEGGNEMTGSMQMIREFCDILITPDKATRTRIVSAENPYLMFCVMLPLSIWLRYNKDVVLGPKWSGV